MTKPTEKAAPHSRWRRPYLITAAITALIAFLFLVPRITLVPSTMPPSGETLFSFSDYVAALALLLVVLTISDFRFRYRVRLLPRDIRAWAFWTALVVGFLILLTDYWFLNSLPIPDFLNGLLNIKLVLAAIFLTFVFYLNFVAFIRPPVFKASNAEQYARVLFKAIGEGNKDKLAVVAEELARSLPNILKLASEVPRRRRGEEPPEVTHAQGYAHDLLMMLGDPRFCEVVATQTPWLATDFFWLLRKHRGAAPAAAAFSCNVSSALIMNPSSTLHQEGSFFSGLIGELRPISKALYGSWEIVEACSSGGLGPLDLHYSDEREMGKDEAEALMNAAITFADDYFQKTKGRMHSYALTRVISTFEGMGSAAYRLNEMEDYYQSKEYARFSVAVEFAVKLVELLGKHDVPQQRRGTPEVASGCPYDRVALLYFELIFDASTVTSEKWVNWAIQHNLVWSKLFSREDFPAMARIKRKVIRLLWAEIKQMDRFANFKGIRILGLCLNVLGLKKPDTVKPGWRREFCGLRKLMIEWTEKNYYRLLINHPKVAAALPNGTLTYDADRHRLVKTYGSELGRRPNRHYLPIIVPPDGKVEPDPYENDGFDD